MKLFDIFKKIKKIKKEAKKVEKKEKKKAVKREKRPPIIPASLQGSKAGKKPAGGKEEIKAELPRPQKKLLGGQSFRILSSPHITEKATFLAEHNKYVFKVWQKTNKPEIKKAVESIYGVNVTGVKIININPKKRRVGKQEGWRKGYKKAIVEVKKGQKIEILPR